jgi:predicted RNase H-like HicB family nuclease
MRKRYAIPLTFLFSREEEAWPALACEIGVASQGDSVEDAREMLKEAVEVSVSSLVEIGKLHEIEHPASPELLASFLSAPSEDQITEYHTLLITVESEPAPRVEEMEFVSTAVRPGCCRLPAAA